jgi:hypothetical protein
MYLSALKRIGPSGGLAALMEFKSGPAGTRQTLELMASIINAWKIDPSIRDKTLQIVAGQADKDDFGEVLAVFDFVQNAIRYRSDVNGVETLHTPNLILAQSAGDCDDKVILICTMLESIGKQTRSVAVGFAQDNGEFSHVFAQVWLDGQWVSLETTEPVDLGWTPPGIVQSMIVVN